MDAYFCNRTWPEIEAIVASTRTPVGLWPVGAVEPHGPHLPLCTDGMISSRMCERAAELLAPKPDLEVLILPPMAFGVTRYARSFPGAIHITESTLHSMLVDVLRSLVAQGLQHNMIVNNHFEPEQVQTIHHAIDTVVQETRITTGYVDLTRRHRANLLTDEFREGGSHAGQYETSLVLADDAGQVRRPMLASLPPVNVDLASEIADGKRDFGEMGLTQAYNGKPADASREEGEETYEVLAHMLASAVDELVAGTGGRDQPGRYGRTGSA